MDGIVLNRPHPARRRTISAIAALGYAFAICATGVCHPASAQDIPGIENCTTEKAMDRRTSCLQSNVNYLKAQITQLTTVSLNQLQTANRQIDALKASVVTLQATIAELKAAAEKKPAEAPKPEAQKSETPADATKK